MSDVTTQEHPATTTGTGFNLPTTRRKLLKGLYGLLTLIGAGNLFYALGRYWAPGAAGQADVEIPMGQIPEGSAMPFQYGGAPGILLRAEDGSFRALSLVCTHLACTVSWNPEKREFYCPCHEGFFDAEGKVLSGPPPTPLERWKVEIRGDKVVIGT